MIGEKCERLQTHRNIDALFEKGVQLFYYGGAMKVFLAMFCLIYAVEGYTFANKTKLHKDLFKNYEKVLQPYENQMMPNEINFFFYMKSLTGLQDSSGKIGVLGSLGVEWNDFRLAWNPLDYGGDLNQTSVFVKDIWTPYLVLMNPYKEIKPILSGEFSCKLWYNGYVSCMPPNIFEASCGTDVRFYPFDHQNCTLQFYVPGYFSSDLKFKPASSTFNLEMYEEDGLWTLTSTRIFVHTLSIDDKSFETLKLEIKMRRRWRYYIISLSPVFSFNLMQILVFWLPNKSGERIAFSITVLLAEVVFLTVIQEKLPEASKPDISYLVYKQVVDMIISFFIVAAVVIGSNIYNKAKTNENGEIIETTCYPCKCTCSCTAICNVTRCFLCKNNLRGVTYAGKVFDRVCFIIFFFILALNNLVFFVKMRDRHSF